MLLLVSVMNCDFISVFNQSSAGEGNAEADETVQIQDVSETQIGDLEETEPATTVEPDTDLRAQVSRKKKKRCSFPI